MRTSLIAARKSIPGLTQKKIAEELGIDRTAYTRIERGNRPVSVEEAMVISRLIGKPIEDIFMPCKVLHEHIATGTEGK